MICKIYGIVDLLAAVIIFFGLYGIPDIVKLGIIIIMLIKGVPSIMGDMMCRIYSMIDISVAVILWFALPLPDFLRIFIVVVMFFKGIPSLFAH